MREIIIKDLEALNSYLIFGKELLRNGTKPSCEAELLKQPPEVQEMLLNPEPCLGNISQQALKDAFLRVLESETEGFIVDDLNGGVIDSIVAYIRNDPAFLKPGRSFSKGLLIRGPIGSGKTKLLEGMILLLKKLSPLYTYIRPLGAKPDSSITNYITGVSSRVFSDEAVKQSPQQVPKIVTAGSIVRSFNIDGDLVFDYTIQEGRKTPRIDYAESYLAIDDLGTENMGRHYGNQVNVLAEILMLRYEHKSCTHSTSNLDLDEIKQVYGERVFDRLISMYNDIPLLGDSRRT